VSYYTRPMGDYKTYGYGQQGDLKRLWRSVRSVAAPIIGGLIGGPFGAVAGAALAGRSKAPAPAPQVPTSFPGVGMQAGMFPAIPAVIGAAGRVLTGRVATAAGAGMAAGRMMTGPGGQQVCPSGYHFAKDGSGRLVRNRRMNIANPRALRRAMRRVQGFEKMAKRTITFTKRVRMKTRKS